MKLYNIHSIFFVFSITLLILAGSVTAADAIQTELDPAANKLVQLGAGALEELVPVVGPFISPLVGLLFIDKESDKIGDLNEALRGYIDIKTTELEKRLLEDRNKKYIEHLNELNDFMTDRREDEALKRWLAADKKKEEVLNLWKSLQTLLADESHSFMIDPDDKSRTATPRVVLLGVHAQFHLNALTQLGAIDPDNAPRWRDYGRKWTDTYKSETRKAVDQAIKERLDQIEPISTIERKVHVGNERQGGLCGDRGCWDVPIYEWRTYYKFADTNKESADSVESTNLMFVKKRRDARVDYVSKTKRKFYNDSVITPVAAAAAAVKAEFFITNGMKTLSDDPQAFLEAQRLFDRALEIDPTSSAAYFWRGNTQINRKLAIEDYTQAIKLNPRVADWHAYLNRYVMHLDKEPCTYQHLRAAYYDWLDWEHGSGGREPDPRYLHQYAVNRSLIYWRDGRLLKLRCE